MVAEALVFMQQTENRVYEAELYRLQGELLLVRQSKRQPAKDTRQKPPEIAESFLEVGEGSRSTGAVDAQSCTTSSPNSTGPLPAQGENEKRTD